jgi:hypothetical protein
VSERRSRAKLTEHATGGDPHRRDFIAEVFGCRANVRSQSFITRRPINT